MDNRYKLMSEEKVRSEMEAAAIDEKIYVIGGLSNANRATSSVFVFDTVTEDWQIGTPMPLALHHAAAAYHDEKIYVIGGYLDGWIPSRSLLIYDSKSDSWSVGSDMPTPRGALTANFVDGKQAYVYGLVNNVVSSQTLLLEALKLAIKISNNSPIAVQSAIRAMNAGYDKNQDGFEVEVDEFGKCFGTNDFKEGVDAFLNKRKPEFK